MHKPTIRSTRLSLSTALFLGALLFAGLANAATAGKQLYIKDGDSFKAVTAREAAVEMLRNPKLDVVQCTEERLTDSLKFKAKSSD